MKRVVLYTRVSSSDQHTETQHAARLARCLVIGRKALSQAFVHRS